MKTSPAISNPDHHTFRVLHGTVVDSDTSKIGHSIAVTFFAGCSIDTARVTTTVDITVLWSVSSSVTKMLDGDGGDERKL